ncbi:hypothetical protein V6N12_023576 [Hibiscus sabdariffa]|uniref:RNase H type-1 domain-containing protein n=1 Tax=Hibiscus sabdariffa TaxID=183260 RepID=A0ABR2FY33_9ROSI
MLRVQQDESQQCSLQQHPNDSPSRWLKPFNPFIKTNTDGGKFSSLGRSFMGVWLGILLGIDVSDLEKGFKYVILELDSVVVAGVVCKGYNGPHNFRNHLDELWCRSWHVQVVLVKRQANQVTDACVKLADCNTLDIIHFDKPSTSIIHLLQLDLSIGR